jgi:hypothetical protein
MERARQTLIVLFGCASALYWLVFAGAMAMSELGAPAWLPLPWSDAKGFIEAPDGRVCVELMFYARIVCNEPSGAFSRSYPGWNGGGGDRALAVDAAGRIYHRVRNHVTILDSGWQRIGELDAPDGVDRTWTLGLDGRPTYTPGSSGKAPTRPVSPGGLLFAGGAPDTFTTAGGDLLVRDGGGIRRVTAAGKTLGYGSPAYLAWAVFPIPGVIGCWGGILAVLGLLQLKGRRPQPDGTRGGVPTRG